MTCRHRSRIKTDRIPKRVQKAQAGSGGRLFHEFFGFLLLKGGLSWFSESFREDGGQISTWKVFYENIFIMKNVMHFQKMLETGVDDPRLTCYYS